MQCAGVTLRYTNPKGDKFSHKVVPPSDAFAHDVAKVIALEWAKPKIKKGTIAEDSITVEFCDGEIKVNIEQDWGYYDDSTIEIVYACTACGQNYHPPMDKDDEPFLPTQLDHIATVINDILSVVSTPEDFVNHVP